MRSPVGTSRRHVAYRKYIEELDESVVAWFGGWLSADGSIHSEQKMRRPGISFKLCDRDPLQKFAELFGNRVGGPVPASGFGKRDRFEWQVSGWKAIVILERVTPWLSKRYTDRARLARERFAVNYRRLTPEQVVEIKSRLKFGRHGIGRQLAREFGVTSGMISNIKHGRAWADT
jgi:hypothetical protein